MPTSGKTSAPADSPFTVYDRGELSTQPMAQTGLNLCLRLKSPAQMMALLQTVQAAMPAVRDALQGLHYVHFARFLPTPDGSALWVITEFDGDLKSYIMDFVGSLGDVFTAILEFTEDAPRLPVQMYPQDFWAFVQRNNVTIAQPWSAYGQQTVIEIQGSRAVLKPKPPAPAEPYEPPALDFADIQGNILRGYRVNSARYLGLHIGEGDAAVSDARKFLASLVSGDEHAPLQVTTATPHAKEPPYCLNIGFTHAGLAALAVDATTLGNFPQAFREGPANPQRAASVLGDVDQSAPENWELGGPSTPPVHILLSFYAKDDLDPRVQAARDLCAAHGLEVVWHKEANFLPGGVVHFGFKDGIGQPRIEGMPKREAPDMQPAAKAGEFLLGKNYVNQYNGNFIGDLPNALCDNATYASFALLEQDVAAFESAIQAAGAMYNMDPELIAAKIMGRWRNGAPLALSPMTMDGVSDNQLNNFDYAPTAYHPAAYDDFEGLRCPVGAHNRRMNPRGATVTGKPHSRRIIRRGLPYGPPFDPAHPNDGIERGLVGTFICGDIEMQCEFLQSVWANKDLATAGLRDTRDPVIGAQDAGGGKFVIRTPDTRDPITLHLPRFVTTRGRLYVFMPGIGGLRHLASM